MLNKAMMGDRLGTTSQAETGLPAFVHGESLRREGREGGGEDGVSTICLLREKVCRSERMCLCGVRCVGMCVCVEPERHKQTGRGGPQSVPLPLLSPETNPLKPTRLCHKKTENNNKSKQRTSLLSPNGFKSSLPVVTADERIIKHRTVLTERSHTVQAAIHNTTVCLFVAYS